MQLKEKYYTLLCTLRGKEKEIEAGLQQLKEADEEGCQQLRPVLEAAANDLKLALSTAEQELETTEIMQV